ncbi:MAG TPA: hypothetical protein VLC98_00645 [Phnomibacter sp.]|nr:hypothetical protein [Phnomibacter sp.]
MKAPIIFVAATFIVSMYSCKPNTSDFEIEKIDSSYVKNLPNIADTSIAFAPGEQEKLLGIVQGVEYWVGGNQKQMLLWYNEQGQVVSMTEKHMGILVDSVAFYPNGQRIFKITFDHKGIAEGSAHYYYSDGRIREDGRFAAGIKTGVWRLFDEGGKLKETHEYDRFGGKLR